MGMRRAAVQGVWDGGRGWGACGRGVLVGVMMLLVEAWKGPEKRTAKRGVHQGISGDEALSGVRCVRAEEEEPDYQCRSWGRSSGATASGRSGCGLSRVCYRFGGAKAGEVRSGGRMLVDSALGGGCRDEGWPGSACVL
ncbi:uncharacterized protein A4U43_C07F27220 [Asparagus officinalis]|uniref:Uncharacterized protein n=1 Tax=Asparagus officinalis TaxID=4686 RepID=A0A5P1EF94_ASPOF|nr:uncharacterized protein A4U43_C07F27220 [Asparagus officinalis]